MTAFGDENPDDLAVSSRISLYTNDSSGLESFWAVVEACACEF